MCHGCSCIQWMPCVDILGYMGNECLHTLFGYAVVSHSRVCMFNQQFQERKGYVNSPNWWVMPEARSSTNCPCSCECQAAHTLRPRSRTCSHTLITIDCKCHTFWTMSCETNDWFECVRYNSDPQHSCDLSIAFLVDNHIRCTCHSLGNRMVYATAGLYPVD